MLIRHLIVLVSGLILMGAAAADTQNKTEQTSDVWLKTKIVTTYTLSEHLNPFLIDVDVTNGTATLTGEVESDIERDLAEELAKGIDGIKEVDNKITVSPDAQRDTERGSFYRYVEDANITASVKYRLLLNKNTQGLKIHVTTKNGKVVLDGQVNSDIESDLANQIALNTKGVTDVENNLTISEQQPVEE